MKKALLASLLILGTTTANAYKTELDNPYPTIIKRNWSCAEWLDPKTKGHYDYQASTSLICVREELVMSRKLPRK